MSSMEELQREVERLQLENARLKEQLEKAELNEQLAGSRESTDPKPQNNATDKYPLTLEEYHRYGRQMIVEETGGVEGQVKLKNAKVLVIGAGGLGCPLLPYLAGAGVGTIGIVDNDTVDPSNLHRQILHDSYSVGMLKCDSAKRALNRLNPNVNVTTYPVRLDNTNAFQIFEGYNLIMDCTDTPVTRYLINDVAVNLGLTVVSASGVRTEGQLTILNFENMGPCYRCFYPVPPSPNSVSSCQEGGVIGPCIGVLGVMMAVEAMKVILGLYSTDDFEPFLMQYAGFPKQSLRTFRMRRRKEMCAACGTNPTITREAIETSKINYTEFCGSRNYNVCVPEERITVQQFDNEYLKVTSPGCILLDVRPEHHYQISHLPNTYNITVKSLRNMDGSLDELQKHIPSVSKDSDIVVLCRFGNDSQLATRLLKDDFGINNVKDVQGGFFKYIDDIDPSIPKY
ncbi:Uba4 protein [Maudiozyma humilis]|uniref:Needs CLA4 to survive protein 3 n=1 Tax=Maudiozyma humilis TaxID=51915 RepID=A0AAV5S4W9_MAUHU|nr:Uba4 protein [Kazachstania humilis]